MSLATDVWNELRKIREHKAFYAAAGAGDAAKEALRTLPDRLARLQAKADLAALSGRAMEYVIVAGARAVQAYDEFAERGMQVLGPPEPERPAELARTAPTGAVVDIRRNGDRSSAAAGVPGQAHGTAGAAGTPGVAGTPAAEATPGPADTPRRAGPAGPPETAGPAPGPAAGTAGHKPAEPPGGDSQ